MKIPLFILSLFLSEPTFAYEMKILSGDGYSNPWVILYHNEGSLNEPLRGRIHFHGYTQEPISGKPVNPTYDFEWKDPKVKPTDIQLRQFVEVYGFHREILYHPNHLVIIPIARGHCDQYGELSSPVQFDRALGGLLKTAGIKSENFSLTMASAHSGGGAFLAKLIEKPGKYFFRIVRADFFDAIYSDTALDRIRNWIRNPGKHELRLFSVPGQTPAIFGEKIFATMAGSVESGRRTVDGVSVSEKTKNIGTDSRILQIQNDEMKLNHWSLIRSLWIY